MKRQRLYINIDHIATLRQARRGAEPDPVEGAAVCERAGADGITAHLREDRRHIQDDDIERLATSVTTVLNLEMACTDEMLAIAERLRPHQVTLVPERREEITTEGGLDVSRDRRTHRRRSRAPQRARHSHQPLHRPRSRTRSTGRARSALWRSSCTPARTPTPAAILPHLRALRKRARHGASIGLAVHAGHGLTVDNVDARRGHPRDRRVEYWPLSRQSSGVHRTRRCCSRAARRHGRRSERLPNFVTRKPMERA